MFVMFQDSMLKDLKGCENVIRKSYIHVRVSVGGSPLEYPGTVLIYCFTVEGMFFSC